MIRSRNLASRQSNRCRTRAGAGTAQRAVAGGARLPHRHQQGRVRLCVLRLVVKFWPRSRSPALALWARISQARRSAPYLRTRTGVAISGLIVAWPRESFLAFLATPFMW